MATRQDKSGEIILCPSDHKNYSDWHNIFDFLGRSLDYSRIGTALDLGSGTGNLLCHFLDRNSECACTGVDTNKDLLHIIQDRNPRIRGLEWNINNNLVFDDGSFDFVSCIGTLHYPYIRDHYKILQEMKRVSKKYIFADFLLKNSPYSFLQRLRYPSFTARKYTKREIGSMIDSLKLRGIGARGGRVLFPRVFPYWGREVFCLLEK